MKKIYPMSLRANAHDIIRTWDFYTIAKGLYHTGKLPWKDVMIAGHVLAQKGEKISKSKCNSGMEPEKLLEQYSADAIRYWTATGKKPFRIRFPSCCWECFLSCTPGCF